MARLAAGGAFGDKALKNRGTRHVKASVERILSKGAKLFVLLLWALVASGGVSGGLVTAAWAQSAVIREIVVDGNRRVEPETVKSYLTFNVGDVYDAGKADESVQNLFQTGLFSDVRIDRQEIHERILHEQEQAADVVAAVTGTQGDGQSPTMVGSASDTMQLLNRLTERVQPAPVAKPRHPRKPR